MIEGTFSFVPGIGPSRERELRARGIRNWEAFPAAGEVLSKVLDDRIRRSIGELRSMLARGEVVDAALKLPMRERWRAYGLLEPGLTFLDIETSMDQRVTVIGTYTVGGGPKLFVRGWNLGAFVEEPLGTGLVTFNGASFDVPVLRRTFPHWRAPAYHLDLRPMLAMLGEKGGLKAIEKRNGLARPGHLDGVDGLDAIRLWDTWRREGDAAALGKLCEYNLYDVVQLRSLAELGARRLAARTGWPVDAEAPTFVRGDVLLDMTRAVQQAVAGTRRNGADALDDEERRTGL